ncbi:MAG: VOC family protein [Ilumatobacteraceae bacterium]
MPERSEYKPGTPSWIDLASPDPDASAVFYGGLFGWSVDADPRPEAGGYRMASLGGKFVAGLGPQMEPGGPPSWAMYITVADIDATVARAEIHNGVVIAGPMDVLDAGRMAVIQDTNEVLVSAWHAGNHIGAGLVNEAGAFTWSELAVHDIRRAHEFYQAVFGWDVDEATSTETTLYFNVDGTLVCAAHQAVDNEPLGWMVWFGTDDCDASAAKVTELGGTVLSPPAQMGDIGRATVVTDPHGATFGIIKF